LHDLTRFLGVILIEIHHEATFAAASFRFLP